MLASDRLNTSQVIPAWMIWLQCICFSVLYAIWALHETILVRHVCLIIGALIGLYEIYIFRRLFFQRKAVPIWLLLSLFIWVTFHLFYLSNDFENQLTEYMGIWKRVFLGALFALGLGVALANANFKPQQGRAIWALIYLGLLAPTVIYIVKYFLTNYGLAQGWTVPNYLRVYNQQLVPFNLPKANYVCFCVPTLAVALGQNYRNIHLHRWLSMSKIIYLATIPAVFFVFYGENIKNGVIYSILLLVILVAAAFFFDFKKHLAHKLVLTLILMLLIGVFATQSYRVNDSWRTFSADAKIALATDQFTQWKYGGAQGYPLNDLGVTVSVTNYERMAWAKEGLKLLLENPLGYGLIQASFGHLAKITWPDSNLTQAHSGWIDLGLGLGIPGLVMVLAALLLAMWQLSSINHHAHNSQPPWNLMAYWTLLALLLVWCTTEASQQVFFDSLIFWIALSSGLSLTNCPITRSSNRPEEDQA